MLDAHLSTLITPKTKLVALAHVSNTLGCVTPSLRWWRLRRPTVRLYCWMRANLYAQHSHSSTAATARATRLTSSLLLLHTGASYAD